MIAGLAGWARVRRETRVPDENVGLGELLRTIADAQGLTGQDLRAQVPGWSGDVIDAFLNGTRRPGWDFVTAFLNVVGADNEWHREVLERRVRRVWEGTSGAARANGSTSGSAAERGAVTPGGGDWISALQTVAGSRRVIGSVQGSICQHELLENGLADKLDRLSRAVTQLSAERDGLRRELALQQAEGPEEPGRKVRGEVERLRSQLRDAQQRLNDAEQLRAETGRRLGESERQRRIAERLKGEAIDQAELAQRRLAELEHRPTSTLLPISARPQPYRARTLDMLGEADQEITGEILDWVDRLLSDEARKLGDLGENMGSINGSSRAPDDAHPGRPALRRRILIGTAAGIIFLGLLATTPIIFDKSQASNWVYVTGGAVVSRPVQADGTIYVGSDDHNVYALNATTGQLRWKYSTGGSVLSRPVVARGIVYVGSNDHNVYALNATTGQLRWTYTTEGPISSSPAVARGLVYIGSDDHDIYALNVGTGHLHWRHATDGPVFSSPVVANGTIYVGNHDKIYALNADNGHVRWRFATGDPKTAYSASRTVLSRPELADGVVYVGDGHEVYALNTATGQLLWKHATAGPVLSSPAVADGVVYVGSDDHTVYALNAATGQLRWTYTTEGPVESSPEVADGLVYFGSEDHSVYALNAANGSLRWEYATKEPVESSPAVAHGFVYIGSDDHKVYALNAATGS
jgi:outer membrane protein assembly factor BamB